jgi:hypothetical protein
MKARYRRSKRIGSSDNRDDRKVSIAGSLIDPTEFVWRQSQRFKGQARAAGARGLLARAKPLSRGFGNPFGHRIIGGILTLARQIG